LNSAKPLGNFKQLSDQIKIVPLKDSTDLALQIGTDITFNDHWFTNVSAQYFQAETTVKINVAETGATFLKSDLELNPWVFNLSGGYRF
jgi:outer membrane protein